MASKRCSEGEGVCKGPKDVFLSIVVTPQTVNTNTQLRVELNALSHIHVKVLEFMHLQNEIAVQGIAITA